MRMRSQAKAGDLILINPFPYGISFQHYYHGAATDVTIPPLSDLRSHRADLLKEAMMSPDPILHLLGTIEDTLRQGHAVWLIGGLPFLPQGQAPVVAEPGRETPQGWLAGGDYYRAWGEQAGSFMQQHAGSFARVPVPVNQPVIHYENVPLSVFRGWRD